MAAGICRDAVKFSKFDIPDMGTLYMYRDPFANVSELLVLTDALCCVKTCILATNQIRQRLNDNSFRCMHDRAGN